MRLSSQHLFFSPNSGQVIIPHNQVLLGDVFNHSLPSPTILLANLPPLYLNEIYLGQAQGSPQPTDISTFIIGTIFPPLTAGQIWREVEDTSGNLSLSASDDLTHLWNAINTATNIVDPLTPTEQLPVPQKLQQVLDQFNDITIYTPASESQPPTLIVDTDEKIAQFFNSFANNITLAGSTPNDLGGKIASVFNAFNQSIQSPILSGAGRTLAEGPLWGTADKIESVFNAFNNSIEGVGSTADKISGVFDAFNSSIKTVEGVVTTTADKITSVFDAFNKSIKTAEGAVTSTADKIENVFNAFNHSIQGVGETADKISGVFNSFTNAVNAVTNLPEKIGNTADAITHVFEGFTSFNVSLEGLALNAGYNFAKGFIFGAFVEQIITYNDLANSRVNIRGDMKGTGYITVPRFNLFTPKSWWSHDIAVTLNDVIQAKSGRGINIVFDNAMPFGKIGNRQKSSSAFNICSTDSGSNFFSHDPRPVTLGLTTFYTNFYDQLFEGGQSYGQKGYCFKAEFEYVNTSFNSNDKLAVKTFGLYEMATHRKSEHSSYFGLTETYAHTEKEEYNPLFEIERGSSFFRFYRTLRLPVMDEGDLPSPVGNEGLIVICN